MSIENQKTKWIAKDYRFVGFLDILGFKDLVMRKSHDEIYTLLSKISKTRKMLEETAADEDKFEKWGNAEVRIINFSDSIVVFSKNDDYDNFKYFLIALRWLFADCIKNGIPIKGGIAHGEISFNKTDNIYFGQAIIDAYLIEEDVEFFGIVAHNSIDSYINTHGAEFDLKYIRSFLFEEKIPLKSGKIKHLSVNWFSKAYPIRKIFSGDEINNSITSTIEEFRKTVSGSPRRYIDNTLDVFSKIDIEEIRKINKK